MTDAFTDDLFAPTPFEAARVVFPVSRLVCDVERFPDDADEPMALRGMGAVYVRTTDGLPLREHLTPAERARIIENWYQPHHQRLTRAVDHVIADGKSCVIVDCHSFSARPLPHEPDQDPDRPDICMEPTAGIRPHGYEMNSWPRHQLPGFPFWLTVHSPVLWFLKNTIGGSQESEP
jgi:N-formylglutamate deformylase